MRRYATSDNAQRKEYLSKERDRTQHDRNYENETRRPKGREYENTAGEG